MFVWTNSTLESVIHKDVIEIVLIESVLGCMCFAIEIAKEGDCNKVYSCVGLIPMPKAHFFVVMLFASMEDLKMRHQWSLPIFLGTSFIIQDLR